MPEGLIVMLRIAPRDTSGEERTLNLEGRIVGPWVDQLRRSCEEVLTMGAALTLDLAEVDFVDQEGARLLMNLMGSGVALVNCPAFVQEQLKGLPRY